MHYAEITHLEFNNRCSIKSLLTKGDGSINMINVSLYVVKRHFYPHTITTINLLDDSHVFNDNGKRVNLYYAYLATHGQTWYQAHFGAKVLGGNDRFNTDLLKLNDPINIDLDRFMDTIIKTHSIDGINMTDRLKTIFNNALDNKFSWRQLLESTDKKIIYNCIGPNLDYMFETIIGIEMPRKWFIDLGEWDHTKVTINKITEVNDREMSKIMADVTKHK